MKVTDNLRYYLHEARLPDMPQNPPSTSKTEPLPDSLGVRPRRYRRLEAVHAIDLELLGDMVFDWTEFHIPSMPLGVDDGDERTGERFTVSCRPCFPIPSLPLGRASDIERVSSWIDNFPLESVLRAMHLLYPESKSSDSRFVTSVVANRLLGSCRGRKSPKLTVAKANASTTRYLCFPLPRGRYRRKSYKALFVRSGFHNNEGPKLVQASSSVIPFRSKNGYGARSGIRAFPAIVRWFVVTTYRYWVFGVFSPDWSDVFVSPLYKYDSCDPTILELLLFWVVSAMGYEGGWTPPETRTQLKLPVQCLSATVTDLFFNVSKAMAMVAYGADCSIVTPAL
ncbi:hypothetical protein EDD17DRAFT_1542593 [Pisolithus thermaeus]|nr:hypothetical protein EDD17DRAFT_1542593 [Pisolithus thermaeus]